MLLTDDDLAIARTHASKAIAAGDLRKAERWVRIVERDVLMREREARYASEVAAGEAAAQRVAELIRRERGE